MSELLNPRILNLASLALSVYAAACRFVVMVFVNRASSRTNQQIELLQALLDQQSGKTRCCAVSAKPMSLRKKRLQDFGGRERR